MRQQYEQVFVARIRPPRCAAPSPSGCRKKPTTKPGAIKYFGLCYVLTAREMCVDGLTAAVSNVFKQRRREGSSLKRGTCLACDSSSVPQGRTTLSTAPQNKVCKKEQRYFIGQDNGGQAIRSKTGEACSCMGPRPCDGILPTFLCGAVRSPGRLPAGRQGGRPEVAEQALGSGCAMIGEPRRGGPGRSSPGKVCPYRAQSSWGGRYPGLARLGAGGTPG